MKRYEHIELLGRAFAYGEIDAFVGCMNAECKYHSDYAHKHLNTAEQIEETVSKARRESMDTMISSL